jgi:dihydroflavonol-4-reductase
MELTFDKKTIFLLTGAFGHLGNVVTRQLLEKGARVRALIWPSDLSDERFRFPVELYRGDLRSVESIKLAFEHQPDEKLVIIHMASIISTLSSNFKRLYQTNVVGTRNLLDLAVASGATRFVYVSSVHALTEEPWGQVNRERTDFDPKHVHGVYAKSKAMASRLVLSYKDLLDLVILHPSGIIGPYDYQYSQTNQVFYDFLKGKLPFVIKGGYDFVDVRDVADGIIAATLQGRSGENYILSGRYITIAEMMKIISGYAKKKRPKVMPLWIAQTVAPFVEAWSHLTRKRPLFTPYSLYTTSSNGHFSHEKAFEAFGYMPRSIEATIYDIYRWYYDFILSPRPLGRIKKKYL